MLPPTLPPRSRGLPVRLIGSPKSYGGSAASLFSAATTDLHHSNSRFRTEAVRSSGPAPIKQPSRTSNWQQASASLIIGRQTMELGRDSIYSSGIVRWALLLVVIMLSAAELLTIGLSTTVPNRERPKYQPQGGPLDLGLRPQLDSALSLDAQGRPAAATSPPSPPLLRLLYPMAPYGPSNQILGLQEAASMAVLLNRTLILPVLW